MDLNELQEEISFLRALKQNHLRRLRLLKLEQAKRGYSCPPEVVMEIEDIGKKITEIDGDLENKQQLLVNMPEFNEAFLEYSGVIRTFTQQPIEEIAILLVGMKESIELVLNNLEKLTTRS